MTRFAVEPADLQRCDAVLGEAAGRSRAALGRVVCSARDLLGGGWHGPAASAFQLGWEHWLDGANTMLAALDDMAAALGACAADYDSAEGVVRADVARTSA